MLMRWKLAQSCPYGRVHAPKMANDPSSSTTEPPHRPVPEPITMFHALPWRLEHQLLTHHAIQAILPTTRIVPCLAMTSVDCITAPRHAGAERAIVIGSPPGHRVLLLGHVRLLLLLLLLP